MIPQKEIIKLCQERLEKQGATFEEHFKNNFAWEENVMIEYEEGNKIVKITFGEMKKMVYSVAYALEDRLEHKKDIYIALNMDNSFQWIVGFWAILASGNKPYLVNARHPLSLTSGIVKTLGIEYSLDNFKPCTFDAESIDINPLLYTEVEDGHQFEWANEMAISTSGTTLNEKICLYSGAEIKEQLKNTFPILKQSKMIRATDDGHIRLLAFLPFYHIFGLITVNFWFTFFGYEIVLLKDYAPTTILHTIRKFRVTHIFAVPLFWHSIEENVLREVAKKGDKVKKKFEKGLKIANSLPAALAAAFSKKAFKEVRNSLFGDTIKFCISGGSFLRPSAQYLLNGLGYSLYNGYGTSEIGITSCEMQNSNKIRNLGAVGKPFASVEYKIEDGCLLVKGKSTCFATIINGERIPTSDWFNTLDLVEAGKDGRYYVRGRKSDLIISANGENINPDELEAHFDFSPYPVLGFSILGLKEVNDVVAMVLQVPSSLSKEEVAKIKDYIVEINDKLPSTSQVQSIYFTFDPLQAEGAIKVSRAYLRRGIDRKSIHIYAPDQLFDQGVMMERSDVTEALIEIFAKVLNKNKEDIKPYSHFNLDLGGTSLDYYTLLIEVNERFQTSLEYDPDNPLYTVADFEKYLKELEL